MRSLLLALLLLPAIARAQSPGPGEKEILHEGSFIVYSDEELSTDKARAYIERVKAAYDFVADEEHWKGDAALDRAIGLRVVSDARMKEISKKAKGVAIGRDTFVVSASYLDKERSERTLAHELTHLQDRRHLETKHGKLPHWWNEGRAVASGRAYEAKLGVLDPKYEESIARVASSVTAAEARKVLEEEAFVSEKKMASVFRMEAIGFFFLEFVRVHLSVDGLDARLAKVVVKVGGGASLRDAFFAEFQKKLEDVQSAFYEHLEKTAGKPERFAGTVFEKK